MNVRSGVKKLCTKCQFRVRKGILYVICDTPKHKQKQG